MHIYITIRWKFMLLALSSLESTFCLTFPDQRWSPFCNWGGKQVILWDNQAEKIPSLISSWKKIPYPGPLWFVVYSVWPVTTSKRSTQISELYLLCDPKIWALQELKTFKMVPVREQREEWAGRKIAVHDVSFFSSQDDAWAASKCIINLTTVRRKIIIKNKFIHYSWFDSFFILLRWNTTWN